MSSFIEKLNEHRREIARMSGEVDVDEFDPSSADSYAVWSSIGAVKPFTVRLPVTTIAMIDELQNWTLFDSKAEMVFELIHSALDDLMDSEPKDSKLVKAMNESGMKAWKAFQEAHNQESQKEESK